MKLFETVTPPKTMESSILLAVTPPCKRKESSILEGGVVVSNNFSKWRQHGFKRDGYQN